MKNSSLAKNMLIYSIGNMGSKVLSFLIVPFYTYYISMVNFGKFDYINTIIFLLTPLLTLRINDAAYRYLILSKNNDEKRKIITNSFFVIILSIILAIVILLLVFKNELFLKYLIIVQFIFINLKEYYLDISRGLSKNLVYSLCGLLSTFIMLVINFIGIVILGLDISTFFIANIISSLVCIIILEIKIKLIKSYLRLNNFDFEYIERMLRYCIPLIPNFIAWWIITASDRLILKAYEGYESLAIYALANKFPTILIMFTSIFDLAWRDSALSVLKDDYNREYFQGILNRLIKFTVSITIVLIPATKILYDIHIISPDYYDSYWMAILLYISIIFNVLSGYFSVFYLSKAKTKNISLSSCCAAIVNIIINIILVPKIGVMGAIISTVIAYYVMFLYRYIDNKQEYRLSIKIKYTIISIITLSVVMILTRSSSVIFLGCLLFICSGGFILVNIDFVKNIVSKMKFKIKLTSRNIIRGEQR